MTTGKKNVIHTGHPAPLWRRMLFGAIPALILISLFVFPVEGKAEWGDFWKIRPVIVVTFAGAVGGAFYHYMDMVRYKGGWSRVLADFISLVVYIFGLWMGTVLGLNGTLWN